MKATQDNGVAFFVLMYFSPEAALEFIVTLEKRRKKGQLMATLLSAHILLSDSSAK
ncbi:hypothetical protein J9B83_08970 [Marinomonas sp. A79]|uniref:Uncharacterized protein n=1 Tax=Marinomonas vulgaris TaxID=2823372 RepID=A0ABS5HDI2_9GAMM|nr:hypothetical protein [Marinomonas vulgaris]MBR7889079.1 hypothetical protein [Marinomonas vulgaris]